MWGRRILLMVEVNSIPYELRNDDLWYLTRDKTRDYESQIQRDDAIGDQNPIPSNVMTMELSWDRTMKCMRIFIEDIGTWYFTEVFGRAQVISANDKTGKMKIRAIPLLEGEVLYLYRDPKSVPHEPIKKEDIGEVLRPTNNRICYFREDEPPCWRVRDERMPWVDEASRRYVSNYTGDIVMEWSQSDSIAHLFHKGQIILDKNKVAHFYDPELTKTIY